MNNIAIRAEGLGKLYHIGAKQKRYRTFVDAFSGAVTDRFRRIGAAFRASSASQTNGNDTFWALKDVSFEIQRGEVVGVIGRNGAGKSTLLKILSRITEPTCGFAGIHGRVGSLLEVGTGFHQELTGRENVFLNGAILGMKKAEIERKFDEIVAFSEVEKFIDTQVKHYSSGMKMRLAFSVAAHLEPEILIVDEVLAVGDAAFQKKCLGRMGTVASEGRTVLFVSHNLAAIEGLCNVVLVLDGGEVVFSGSQVEGIRQYLHLMSDSTPPTHSIFDPKASDASHLPGRIVEARITSNGQCIDRGVPIGAPLEFHVKCTSETPVFQPNLGIGVDDFLSQRVVTLDSEFDPSFAQLQTVSGDLSFFCRINHLALAPGNYKVKFSLNRGREPIHVVEDAIGFSVLVTDFYRNGGKQGRGFVFCEQHWKIIV